jgi:hypothetical protein
MPASPASPAAERIEATLSGLAELAGPGTGDGDLLALLALCEAAARR